MAEISKERLTALRNEIEMSEQVNKEELEPIISESIQRYVGDFIPDIGTDWDIVLNEIYPIIQNNLPSIFFRNPRAFLKPRNKTYIAKKRNPITGQMEEVQLDSSKSAKTQEHILNYAISEINYKREVRKWLLDALLFPHGILWHGYKGDFGMTEEQSIDIKNEKVFVKRITPMNFIFDPTVGVSNIDEAKWVGRIISIPLSDLLEDDKLDIDKKSLKGFLGFGNKVGKNSEVKYRGSGGTDEKTVSSLHRPLIEFTDKEYQQSNEARFVKIYEIYLRPTKKESRDGKKGWILLLTDEQDKPLRVNEWKIKAEGFPAKILQFNELPDNIFGLDDISTYKEIADQKNSIINIQLQNAQEHTKTWVGISKENADEEDIEKIRNGQNTVVMFDSGSPSERMFVASPGGSASSELYLIDQRVDKNLQDKSGVTDLKKGFLQSGEESATSVKIRAMGGGARPAYRQDIMSDGLKDSLHYLNQLLKQFTPYKDAVRIVGSLDIEWSENPNKEELQADTDVEIDVISMLPENPEKELQELNTVLMLMIQGLSNPIIAEKLKQEGKTINLSPLVEQILMRLRIRNPDIFRNIEPDESMGYVSVQQLKEAEANVQASIKGQQVPFPPKETDDHVAKLSVYTSMAGLLQQMGQVSDSLNQLIQIQSALLQAVQQKNEKAGNRVSAPQGLSQPSVKTV